MVGLAGCAAIDDYDADIQFEALQLVPDDEPREIDEVPVDEEVPDELAECEDLEGNERDPNDLEPKDEVAYTTNPESYQLCANCAYFCPSETSDTWGACSVVEGVIASQHWCALWEPAGDLDHDPSPSAHDDG